jgi:hypothetical protein
MYACVLLTVLLTFSALFPATVYADKIVEEQSGDATVFDPNKGPTPAVMDIRLFGVRGDGIADDTEAIQKTLNAAGVKGGEVFLRSGRYLIQGSLRIPPGVTLRGAAYSPSYIEPLTGTVILATGGRGSEKDSAVFEMGNSCCVMGLTVFYPDQKPDDIQPYPWTFHLEGGDNTVENVTLINSYNGIRIGPKNNNRHRIRSVCGCVLRRGIWVDSCTDIGRIENVQWHCHWWSSKQFGGDWKLVHEYMWRNCEGFIFGRTDWEYVTNTFIFPVNVGYRFIKTEKGAANGQFCGIGADEAQQCVLVEHLQPMGLLITNGQFVAMRGQDPIAIVIQPTCEGSVRLVNCAFWGPSRQVLVSHSQSFVSLNDCYIKSDYYESLGRALIDADSGRLQVRGCSFDSEQPSIRLSPALKHAIITENNGKRGVRILNEIGSAAIVANNESAEPLAKE